MLPVDSLFPRWIPRYKGTDSTQLNIEHHPTPEEIEEAEKFFKLPAWKLLLASFGFPTNGRKKEKNR